MDPHITQYTVYITDNYTGDSIVKENVTETKYTFNIQDELCPTCQVSAWNAGGEGELSEPMLESTPRGKQTFWIDLSAWAFLASYQFSILVHGKGENETGHKARNA